MYIRIKLKKADTISFVNDNTKNIENRRYEMAEIKEIYEEHSPDFVTFPLAHAATVDTDNKSTYPSLEQVEDVAKWVNIHEM